MEKETEKTTEDDTKQEETSISASESFVNGTEEEKIK